MIQIYDWNYDLNHDLNHYDLNHCYLDFSHEFYI